MYESYATVMVVKSSLEALAAFAWPIAIVFVALLFKQDISDLMGRMDSADGVGIRMTFAGKLSQAEKLAKKADVASLQTGSAISQDASQHAVDKDAEKNSLPPAIRELAPANRVTNEWNRIYWQLKEMFEMAFGGEANPPRSVSRLLDRLRGQMLLKSEEVALANKLYDMRNFAYEKPIEVTAEEAVAYEMLGDQFRSAIEDRN